MEDGVTRVQVLVESEIVEVGRYEVEVRVGSRSRDVGTLDRGVVILLEAVDAEHWPALGEQRLDQVGANEASRPGDDGPVGGYGQLIGVLPLSIC